MQDGTTALLIANDSHPFWLKLHRTTSDKSKWWQTAVCWWWSWWCCSKYWMTCIGDELGSDNVHWNDDLLRTAGRRAVVCWGFSTAADYRVAGQWSRLNAAGVSNKLKESLGPEDVAKIIHYHSSTHCLSVCLCVCLSSVCLYLRVCLVFIFCS